MDNESKEMLTEILGALKALDARVARIENGETRVSGAGEGPTHQASRKASIREFLLESKPSDDVQKTLAIGYFLETHEGMSAFNKADLEKGYRSAKEQLPSNINDKVNMSIKNGHIMETEEKKDSMKAWVVTNTGEQYIKNGFKKDVRRT